MVARLPPAKMVSPAAAYVALNVGNFAACATLPREATMQIYHKKAYADKEKAAGTNREADAAWRTMGLTGIITSAALLTADKCAGADDKKKLNGVIGASCVATGAMFATNKFFDEGVKPEMKWINVAGQLGVGAYALSKALK